MAGSVLAKAGDVIFAGAPTGEFRCLGCAYNDCCGDTALAAVSMNDENERHGESADCIRW